MSGGLGLLVILAHSLFNRGNNKLWLYVKVLNILIVVIVCGGLIVFQFPMALLTSLFLLPMLFFADKFTMEEKSRTLQSILLLGLMGVGIYLFLFYPLECG